MGEPTDDYGTHLTELQKNTWYKASVKVAIAVGNDNSDSVLEEFTGGREAVIWILNGVDMGGKLVKIFRNIFMRLENLRVYNAAYATNDDFFLGDDSDW